MYVQKLYEERVHCFMKGGLMTSGVPMDDRTKLRVTLTAISKETEILEIDTAALSQQLGSKFGTAE